jgi:hypothetical protein
LWLSLQAQDERFGREWAMNGGDPQDYFFFTTAFNGFPAAAQG